MNQHFWFQHTNDWMTISFAMQFLLMTKSKAHTHTNKYIHVIRWYAMNVCYQKFVTWIKWNHFVYTCISFFWLCLSQWQILQHLVIRFENVLYEYLYSVWFKMFRVCSMFDNMGFFFVGAGWKKFLFFWGSSPFRFRAHKS